MGYTQKEKGTVSWFGLIFSMEAFLLVMGIILLVFGIVNDKSIITFWGCVIVPGVFILHKVRQTDWTKHWQDMEAEHNQQKQAEARRREREETARKVSEDEKQP